MPEVGKGHRCYAELDEFWRRMKTRFPESATIHGFETDRAPIIDWCTETFGGQGGPVILNISKTGINWIEPDDPEARWAHVSFRTHAYVLFREPSDAMFFLLRWRGTHNAGA